MTSKCIIIFFMSIFITSYFSPLLANNRKSPEITVQESIKEILDSVNEIITSGIQAAEKELKEFQKELKEKGGAIHKKAEKSMGEKLQKMLVELRKIEKALKENLAEGKDLSKEKREQYRNSRQNLEEKVAQL